MWKPFTKPPDTGLTGGAAAVPDPVEFMRTRLGMEPDEKQIEVLRSGAHQGILNCTRQWGKSTVAAVMAVHRAYTRPGCLVIVASPTGKQSAEFVWKTGMMVRQLGIRPRGDGANSISLLFPNGSRIVGVPGKESTVRGYASVSLMLIDEASRVEERMYMALRPMLAISGGDLWLMSTPWGRRGFFYDSWANGGEDWMRMRVPATECPRIPAKFLEGERRVLGSWFEQEFMCEFVDNGVGAFERDLVEGALDYSIEPMEFGSRFRRK